MSQLVVGVEYPKLKQAGTFMFAGGPQLTEVSLKDFLKVDMKRKVGVTSLL